MGGRTRLPKASTVLLLVVLLAPAVFVLTHLGAYPWLAQTPIFRYLGYFVAANTIFFAALGAYKLALRPPGGGTTAPPPSLADITPRPPDGGPPQRQ